MGGDGGGTGFLNKFLDKISARNDIRSLESESLRSQTQTQRSKTNGLFQKYFAKFHTTEQSEDQRSPDNFFTSSKIVSEAREGIDRLFGTAKVGTTDLPTGLWQSSDKKVQVDCFTAQNTNSRTGLNDGFERAEFKTNRVFGEETLKSDKYRATDMEIKSLLQKDKYYFKAQTSKNLLDNVSELNKK